MAKTMEELERELAREKAYCEAHKDIEEMTGKKKRLAKEIKVVRKKRRYATIIKVVKKITEKPKTQKVIRVQSKKRKQKRKKIYVRVKKKQNKIRGRFDLRSAW